MIGSRNEPLAQAASLGAVISTGGAGRLFGGGGFFASLPSVAPLGVAFVDD